MYQISGLWASNRPRLLVNLVDEAALVEFADNAIVDHILDFQSRAGFARQGLFDLDLSSFPGDQWNAIVQLDLGSIG